MRLLVFVFAASFLVLLLACWGVLRVVWRHGTRRPSGSGSLLLREPRPEAELEQDVDEE